MPDWRPIGDHDMLHQRLTCLIGDQSETLTCFIEDQQASSKTHWRPTCLIREPPETDMPDWRPIGDLNMLHRRRTGMSVSNGAYRFKMGLRWGLLV